MRKREQLSSEIIFLEYMQGKGKIGQQRWLFFLCLLFLVCLHLLVLFYAKKTDTCIFLYLSQCRTNVVQAWLMVCSFYIHQRPILFLLSSCENPPDQEYYNCLSANKHTGKDIIFNEFLAVWLWRIETDKETSKHLYYNHVSFLQVLLSYEQTIPYGNLLVAG